MNEFEHNDPCEGCVFRYCLTQVFLDRCIKCRRSYKETSEIYARCSDFYEKEVEYDVEDSDS